MKKLDNRTLDEQIYDNRKKHDKANTVFLKLLAKNKRKANPWGVVRSETYCPVDKLNLRNDLEIN
jgi:hypothetical protein